ncbi:hypothetical protein ACIG47_19160 [Promicromonospora sp. NPDC052451]|uniref:hypothetical protein n=1 Tax=Promicromonospora sp. NPDC052451 TaxID=3364407 RepID=UPI0037C52053
MDVVDVLESLPSVSWLAWIWVVLPSAWIPACLLLVVLSFVPQTEQEAIKTLELLARPPGLRLVTWPVVICRMLVWSVLLLALAILGSRPSTGRQARRVLIILSGPQDAAER